MAIYTNKALSSKLEIAGFFYAQKYDVKIRTQFSLRVY